RVDGCIDLSTAAGARLLSKVINEPATGLKELNIARPGESFTIAVDSWVAVWKQEIERMNGMVEPGWAVTLLFMGKPIVSCASETTNRQLTNLLGCLPNDGPWPGGVNIVVTGQPSKIQGAIWYSLSLADE